MENAPEPLDRHIKFGNPGDEFKEVRQPEKRRVRKKRKVRLYLSKER